MADELTTSSVAESIYSEIIADSVIREIRPHFVMRGFFKQAPSGIASDTYRFLLWDNSDDYGNADSAFNTDAVVDLTENVDMTEYHEIQLETADVTAIVKGFMGTVTTLAETISLLDVWSELKGIMTRTFAEKWEADACAILNDFTYRTDNAQDLECDDILEAIAAIEQRDVTDNLVGVIHTKAAGDLRTDLLAQTTSYWSRDNAQTDGWLGYNPEGLAGTLFRVPFYQTSLVTTDAGDYAGAIFSPSNAMGVLQHFDVRAEYQRDASLLETEIVLSAMYGHALIDDVRGQGLDSTT